MNQASLKVNKHAVHEEEDKLSSGSKGNRIQHPSDEDAGCKTCYSLCIAAILRFIYLWPLCLERRISTQADEERSNTVNIGGTVPDHVDNYENGAELSSIPANINIRSPPISVKTGTVLRECPAQFLHESKKRKGRKRTAVKTEAKREGKG